MIMFDFLGKQEIDGLSQSSAYYFLHNFLNVLLRKQESSHSY